MRKSIWPLAAVALVLGAALIIGLAASWWPSWDFAVSIAHGPGLVVELVAAVMFLLVVGAWFVLSRRDHWKDSRP